MPPVLAFSIFVAVVLGAWTNGHRKRRDDDDWPSGGARA